MYPELNLNMTIVLIQNWFCRAKIAMHFSPNISDPAFYGFLSMVAHTGDCSMQVSLTDSVHVYRAG